MQIKNICLVSSNLISCTISINNNILKFNKLLNILKNNDNIIQYYIYKEYKHDICFLKANIICSVEEEEDIKEIEREIKEDIKKTEKEIKEDIKFQLEEEEEKILKELKKEYYSINRINNKKIDLLKEEDIKHIKEIEREIRFRKNIITNLIEKREIKKLNNLLFKFLFNGKHLKFKKHIKVVKEVREYILNIKEEKEEEDIYNLKDYKKLDYKHNFYYYNNKDIEESFKEIFKEEKIKPYYEYNKVIYNSKRNKELIKLVYSLH